MNEIIAAATAANAIFVLLSVGAAIVTYRSNRTHGRVQSLIQVAEWFRRTQVKDARKAIYKLDRDKHRKWNDTSRENIATWVGYLDVVSTLVLTGDLDRRDFVRMYGDTVFRTIYVLAPWLESQYATFGSQYLKSTQIVLPKLVREWDSLSKKRRFGPDGNYPRELTIAWSSKQKIDPHTFLQDNAVRQFLRK
ncbi:hypothetical protein ATK74_1693 [Propionicimonas paludicola]|uniref:DUF4760 domain-containing protein n=1 Tax=Propionicimonas paludicola TaxID=185243 RepID=A0A2A9CSH8_9ACTN|nr:hypothetical protein [Propionicimonas paludicola]PFG17131.1 hypothetical protein ATK74_1693 [Propionicimonas paludicola]